jgi:hypothetical protein
LDAFSQSRTIKYTVQKAMVFLLYQILKMEVEHNLGDRKNVTAKICRNLLAAIVFFIATVAATSLAPMLTAWSSG